MRRKNKPVNSFTILFTVPLCFLILTLLSACTAFPRRKIVSSVSDTYTGDKPLTLVIKKPDITYAERQDKTDLPFVDTIETIGRKNGFRIIDKGTPLGTLTMKIKEVRFLQAFETKYSVTVTASIHDTARGALLFRLIFTEENSAPLSSFYRLFSIFEIIFKEMSNALNPMP